jgi:hypothetical protein
VNVVAFIVAMTIFILGFWLFGLAFTVTTGQLPIFFGGILSVALAVFIPVQLLRD